MRARKFSPSIYEKPKIFPSTDLRVDQRTSNKMRIKFSDVSMSTMKCVIYSRIQIRLVSFYPIKISDNLFKRGLFGDFSHRDEKIHCV